MIVASQWLSAPLFRGRLWLNSRVLSEPIPKVSVSPFGHPFLGPGMQRSMQPELPFRAQSPPCPGRRERYFRDPRIAPAANNPPIAASALKAVRLLPNGSLKTYPGFSHGMLTVNADVLNADLLEFVAS